MRCPFPPCPLSLLAVFLLGSCGGPADGELGGDCLDGGTCNNALECIHDICVDLSG